MRKRFSKFSRNENGQGLIEYLIIVALMGVATIAIVRIMGQAVASRFATITHALQGSKRSIKVKVDSATYKPRDLGNFMSGASGDSGKQGEDRATSSTSEGEE